MTTPPEPSSTQKSTPNLKSERCQKYRGVRFYHPLIHSVCFLLVKTVSKSVLCGEDKLVCHCFLHCCRARETETSMEMCSEGPMAKKHATGKKVVDKKKKDKKKTLKRL